MKTTPSRRYTPGYDPKELEEAAIRAMILR
jgi:hypothetical protein